MTLGRLKKGFALIDVIVSMMLASITVILAHATLSTSLDQIARAEAVRLESETAVGIRRQLVSWVRASVLPDNAEYWGFFGRPATTAGAVGTTLAFTTDAPGPFTNGRLRLTLAIDNDPTTVERGLVAFEGYPPQARIDTSAVNTDVLPMRALQVLLPGATGFSIRYLHRVLGQYVWTYAWASSGELPEAIEIHISGDSVPPLLRSGLFVIPRGTR